MILALDDPYVAYCFDEACMAFGTACESAMEAVKGKTDKVRRANRENALRKMLGLPQKFRNPPAPGQKKQEDRADPPFPLE